MILDNLKSRLKSCFFYSTSWGIATERSGNECVDRQGGGVQIIVIPSLTRGGRTAKNWSCVSPFLESKKFVPQETCCLCLEDMTYCTTHPIPILQNCVN